MQNVSGAGGTTGSTRAMRADPDGYTILMGQMGTHAAAPALYPNLAYKPDVDFEPIGLVSRVSGADRGAQGLSGEGPQGIRRLCEGEPRQAQHGACRRRLDLLHHLPAAQFDPGGEADAGAVHRRRAGHDRADGRPDRLHVRRHHRRRLAARGRQHQDLCDRGGRSAIRRCRTCRRRRKPGCPRSRPPPGTACSRPRARRSRSSTGSPTRSTRRSTTRPRASACSQLGSDIPDKPQRGQQPFLALVKSEIARWTPIIKAAGITAK